jgi:hypothetical protein
MSRRALWEGGSPRCLLGPHPPSPAPHRGAGALRGRAGGRRAGEGGEREREASGRWGAGDALAQETLSEPPDEVGGANSCAITPCANPTASPRCWRGASLLPPPTSSGGTQRRGRKKGWRRG